MNGNMKNIVFKLSLKWTVW